MQQGATRHHSAVALRPLQVHMMMHQKKVLLNDTHHDGSSLGLQMLAVGLHSITSDFSNSMGFLVAWKALLFVTGACLVG